MRKLLGLILAAVVAWLTGPLAAVAADPATPVVAYVYDGHHEPTAGIPVTGRGPPAIAYDHATPNSANDAASYGPSARPQPWSPCVYNDYDHLVQCAHGDNATVTSRTVPGGRTAGERPVEARRCAANTAPKALNASSRVAPWAGSSLSRLSREGEVMHRVYGGGAGKAGSWLTPINPLSSAAARQGLALPAENAALYVSRVTLPGGVRMQVGTAGPAFGNPGGWAQAQLLERIPLSSFGKGVPLQ